MKHKRKIFKRNMQQYISNTKEQLTGPERLALDTLIQISNQHQLQEVHPQTTKTQESYMPFLKSKKLNQPPQISNKSKTIKQSQIHLKSRNKSAYPATRNTKQMPSSYSPYLNQYYQHQLSQQKSHLLDRPLCSHTVFIRKMASNTKKKSQLHCFCSGLSSSFTEQRNNSEQAYQLYEHTSNSDAEVFENKTMSILKEHKKRQTKIFLDSRQFNFESEAEIKTISNKLNKSMRTNWGKFRQVKRPSILNIQFPKEKQFCKSQRFSLISL